MAKLKIRHYTVRTGARGSVRRFWSPSPTLRRAGWSVVRLSDDEGTAISEAQAINQAADAWRHRQPIDPPSLVRDLVGRAVPHDLQAAVTAPAPAAAVPEGGVPIPKNVKPGSLRALIHAYRHGGDFRKKAEKTRKSYEDNMRALEQWQVTAAAGVVADEPPLEYIAPADLKALWERLFEATPTKANAVLGMARILYNWGRTTGRFHGYYAKDERGQLVRDSAGRPIRITDNPAAQLNLTSVRPNRTEDDLWTPEEVQIFSAVATMEGWPSLGLSVELNEWMGQRQGDVLSLPAARYRSGRLDVNQSKTKAAVFLPVDLVPQLRTGIEENRQRKSDQTVTALTLLVCESTGQQWKQDHFRHVFADVRKVAMQWCPSLEGKTFLTLRHTAVVRLAEAGCEVPEISAITGHTLTSVTQILERYHVRTKRAAESAFRKRLLAENGPISCD